MVRIAILIVRTSHSVCGHVGRSNAPFLTLPLVQNGSFTTSAGIFSPRQSTSNFVPTFAAAAGR